MGSSQSTPAPAPAPASAGVPPAGCPMHNKDTNTAASTSNTSQLNPLNNIPDLAQAPSPGQKTFLPLERTISSIPRATSSTNSGPSACPVNHGQSTLPEGHPPIPGAQKQQVEQAKTWEYPSPQQFYNALVRKGWETPEESIEMMVNIHNWLNEAAWQQVRYWEEKHDGGDRSSLAKFEGRPKELSPKARYHLFMGTIFPSRYGYIRPFDRHDWTIHRPVPANPTAGYTSPSPTQAYTTHRYVIDYYSLPDDEEGFPVFSLDVRPALDSPQAVYQRLEHWWKVKKDAWSGTGDSSSAGGVPGARVQEER
ncbi:cytochrome c and c1 heme-lyase [Meredithblackwellia eburnea MCA 4105]